MSISVEAFFADCPVRAAGLEDKVSSFIRQQCTADGSLQRPIVCVTSGGTTVPLERRCVRFIDNFSGGTRGALSTEFFLEAGYAVIFLNRRHSIQPFTKGLPSGEIMDTLTDVLDCNGGTTMKVRADASDIVRQAVARAKQVGTQNTLLRISFETLFEYLKFLQVTAVALRVCGKQAAFYLAAAASDFYIPWKNLTEHKIQSSEVGNNLHLDLEKVPKMLGTLRRQWAPQAFVVSFKLETDADILVKKACSSIDNYGVHAVIANILDTRKEQVLIVQKPPREGQPSIVTVNRHPEEPFIERQLVQQLVTLHQKFLA